MDMYLMVWQKYRTIHGRASRAEFWTFACYNFLFTIALTLVCALFGLSPIIVVIYVMAATVPGTTVTIRRLHDTDRSGWWMLVSLIPILGSVALLGHTLQPAELSDNRFGPNLDVASGVVDQCPECESHFRQEDYREDVEAKVCSGCGEFLAIGLLLFSFICITA